MAADDLNGAPHCLTVPARLKPEECHHQPPLAPGKRLGMLNGVAAMGVSEEQTPYKEQNEPGQHKPAGFKTTAFPTGVVLRVESVNKPPTNAPQVQGS